MIANDGIGGSKGQCVNNVVPDCRIKQGLTDGFSSMNEMPVIGSLLYTQRVLRLPGGQHCKSL